MSTTFTKLFSSITESTVWCEPSDIRIVWITMLAMADRHGRVWASIPGLANRAQVPRATTEEAIKRFLSPDPDSRTKTNDGRRIKEIDGGWALLNHGKYRAIRDTEERLAYKAQKERERRAKIAAEKAERRGQKRGQNGQTCISVDTNGHNADADADALKTFPPAPNGASPPNGGGGPSASLPRVRGVLPVRLNEVRGLVQKFWNDMNATDCPWSPRDEKALARMLRASPSVTPEEWDRMLDNRAYSVKAGEINRTEMPFRWLAKLRNFEMGPLTKHHDPLQQGRPDAALGVYKH